MSDYKTIHGVNVRDYTTDPDTLITGQVWYDTTNKVLQFQSEGAGAWSSGGNLNVGNRYGTGFGTQTAGLITGGLRHGLSGDRAETESYNGTSWTEVADLNQARNFYGESSVGTSTAGAAIAGYQSPGGGSNFAIVENWNGSSWTETTDINTARRAAACTGSQPASMIFGGFTSTQVNQTEVWNGSSWTEVNDLNTTRDNMAALGTTSAAFSCGGSPGPTAVTAIVESWNGTSWTETTDINIARNGVGGSGSATEGVIFAGRAPSKSGHTERWNGSSWTEQNNLSRSISYVGNGTVSGTSTFVAGGDSDANPSAPAGTEEWNEPVLATKTADTD